MPEEEGKDGLEEEKLGKKVSRDKYMKAVEDKEKAQADSEYWKNEYYKAHADLANLRKSLEEDAREAKRYRAEGFLDELIPALDGFHMALNNPPDDPAIKGYLQGFTYIYNQIQSVLEREGVSELEPKIGEKYDPAYMHAVEAKETDGDENRILAVYAKGYKLHDRLVRPAMVLVSKKAGQPEAKQEEKEDEEIAHKA